MPNGESSSVVSANRFFCESVSTLYTSCLVSAGVRSGICSRWRCPCTRTWGGVFVAMWRSDPFNSTVVFNRSGSVAIFNPWSLVVRRESLLHRFSDDFLDRRESVFHLAQPARAQRDHAFVDRLAAQLEARRADENQLAELVGDLHDFVETDAAFVAGLVAALAAGAFHRRHRVG